jgi:hypothetical protein
MLDFHNFISAILFLCKILAYKGTLQLTVLAKGVAKIIVWAIWGVHPMPDLDESSCQG